MKFMDNILEINGITKKFADKEFMIDNVSLTLPEGCVMGLIGENGAGKTTLIKLIMNIYGRDSGSITAFGGLDNVRDESAVKNKIGYVADEDYLYVGAAVKKIALGMSYAFDEWDMELFEKYMDMWRIDAKKKAGELSKGMKTKVMLALALAHKPELLILDEPTAGLDPMARIETLDILRDFVADGKHSVLFSTHITGDLDKIADYIAMMINGRITEVLSADEAEEKYAVISGEKSQAIQELMIGAKNTDLGFEALVLRKDLPRFKKVNVRTPNFEDLLVHSIINSSGKKSKEEKEV